MRDEDVLITEYRVTVLGERGQYVFDWVDEDASTVEFLEAESDFDDYSDEVKDILQRNGVSIVESGGSDSPAGQEPTSNSEPDPIDGSSTSMMDNTEFEDTSTMSSPENGEMVSNPSSSAEDDEFKPTDSESSPTPIGSEETTEPEKQREHNESNPSPIGSEETTEPEKQQPNHNESDDHKSSSGSDDGKSETHSFIVRMSDPSDRREIINKIKSEYSSAADQLELSGPFEVSYRITTDGIELVHVEDLGTGSSVGEK